MLAAALLTVVSFHNLFAGTVVGFLASALAWFSRRCRAPKRTASRHLRPHDARPAHLPALPGCGDYGPCRPAAAAGAMVFVNTVVLVQSRLGLGQNPGGIGLGDIRCRVHGCSAGLAAGMERLPDRPVMLAGLAVLVLGLAPGRSFRE